METIYLVVTNEKWVDENYDGIEAFKTLEGAKAYFENEIKRLSKSDGLISFLKEMGYKFDLHRDKDMNTFTVYEYTEQYSAYFYICEKTLN